VRWAAGSRAVLYLLHERRDVPADLARLPLAAHIPGHEPIKDALLDRPEDCLRRIGLAEVVEEHRARPDGGKRVCDVLARYFGAEPWIGSNIEVPVGLMFPPGASPSPP